ncbi:glycosyltransferase [Cytobacillus depressus]|uniref:Glycosyltransferase n=1 Tax=Cytobacillus depressus TaxID=1602942 RepID=A0A6L3VBE8_9BACI|nr:glycosyltransferase [Cytobacillus depressus]KAB2338522.1 glycosyltransferase [Cytobacillus depressus]
MLENFIQLKMLSGSSCSASWAIPSSIRKFIECYFSRPFPSQCISLRFYDITGRQFNGGNAHYYQEIIVRDNQSHWVFKGLKKNRSYCAEVGIKFSENYFFPLLRSNVVPFVDQDAYETLNEQAQLDWSNQVSTYTFYGSGGRGESFIFAYKHSESIFGQINGRNLHKKYRNGCLPNGEKRKILLLSWEYPPHIVGGLSRHVHGLAESLTFFGYEVHVITAETDQHLHDESIQGLYIHRVTPLNEHDHHFISWIGGLNIAMIHKALELNTISSFCLIHAHDWLVGACGIVLQDVLQVPLIATIHATEYGRSNGIHTELQKFIHLKEQQLIHFAETVIVCSEYMKNELYQAFVIQNGKKIAIIPNGVHKLKPANSYNNLLSGMPLQVKKRFIFSIGRIVKEKGFDILIHAAHKMRSQFPDIYFIIAGNGPLLTDYKRMVKELALQDRVFFIGFVNDEQRMALLSKCELAVFPSRYEPFGIVALEAMQAGKPTIVANTGGLKGIVQHMQSGMFMSAGSSESFIEQASFLLKNKYASEQMGRAGKERVESLFGWDRIAEETKKIYEETI